MLFYGAAAEILSFIYVSGMRMFTHSQSRSVFPTKESNENQALDTNTPEADL